MVCVDHVDQSICSYVVFQYLNMQEPYTSTSHYNTLIPSTYVVGTQ